MRGTRKKRFGKLEREMLDSLSLGDLLVGALLSGRSTRRMYAAARERAARRQARERAMERLERDGFVERFGEDACSIRLTRGGERALEEIIRHLSEERPKKWNGQWHLVLFDVPERFRVSRNALRGVLRRAGFQKLQQSAYVHAFPCQELIDLLREDPHLKEHVVYAIVATCRSAERFRKKFGI